jgi:hypothetical protein
MPRYDALGVRRNASWWKTYANARKDLCDRDTLWLVLDKVPTQGSQHCKSRRSSPGSVHPQPRIMLTRKTARKQALAAAKEIVIHLEGRRIEHLKHRHNSLVRVGALVSDDAGGWLLVEKMRPLYNLDAVDERTLENVDHQSYLAQIDSRGEAASRLRAFTEATHLGSAMPHMKLKLLYSDVATWVRERETAFNMSQPYQYPAAMIIRTLNFCGLEQVIGGDGTGCTQSTMGRYVKMPLW